MNLELDITKVLSDFFDKIKTVFARKSELADVATSGSYNDLTDTPSHNYLNYNGNHAESASSSSASGPRDGMLFPNAGLYITGTYGDSNTPVSYGNIINVAGAGSGQLLLGWKGWDTGTEAMYYRSHRDTSTGGWGPWKQIAYTDGSVLNASYAKFINTNVDATNISTGVGTWRPRSSTQYKYIWAQKWTTTDFSYSDSDDSSAVITDTADLSLWLSGDTSSNKLQLNMNIDGYIYAMSGFVGSLYGNASTASKLYYSRTIGLEGAANGTATSFDGSSNVTIPITKLNLSPTYFDTAYYRSHPESGNFVHPFIENDLAFITQRGGTAVAYTTTDTDYTSTETLTKVKTHSLASAFNGTPNYDGWSISATTDVVVIDITAPNQYSYSGVFYIDFGNAVWRAKSIQLYAMNNANEAYTLKGSCTDNAGCWSVSFSLTTTVDGSTNNGWHKLRVVLTNFNNLGPRIAQIGYKNHSSPGATGTLVSRGGSTLYGSLLPYTDGTLNIGSSSARWNIYSKALNVETVNATYLNASNKLTVSHSGDSGEIDIVGEFHNSYNALETGQGVGIRLRMAETSMSKYWDIAAIATSNYSNTMGLAFMWQDSEKMRLTYDGRVGISTRDPAYRLDVNGSVGVRNGLNVLAGDVNLDQGVNLILEDGYLSVAGEIDAQGSVTAYQNLVTEGKVIFGASSEKASISYDSTNDALNSSKGFYSNEWISALSGNSGSASSSSSGSDLLTDWSNYNTTISTQIGLGANLGKALKDSIDEVRSVQTTSEMLEAAEAAREAAETANALSAQAAGVLANLNGIIFMKINQTNFDNLAEKDENTLYLIYEDDTTPTEVIADTTTS